MRYVITGAGPAGVIAAETIRKLDENGEITLVGGENERPYSRMAIPYYITGKVGEEGTHLRRDAGHYDNEKIEFRQNTRVVSIDSESKSVELDNGEKIEFDRLLLATGSRAVAPPIPGLDFPGVYPCWTLEDARKIKEIAKPDTSAVLIGAGFIGTIILDALAKVGVNLTVVEAEDRICPRMMNLQGGEIIKSWCENKGIRILTSTMVNQVSQGSAKPLAVELNSGETIEADLVVTATGVTPIIDYLEGSGIETDVGILVNDHLQTNVPEIFAIGDVSQGPDFSGEGRSVHAIQPTAAEHAQVAARNMTGENVTYRGSLIMNVVDTVNLVWYSFGQWEGVEGGDSAEFSEPERSNYIRLEFEGEFLVGSIFVGNLEQIGVMRGLIQNRIPLGDLKAELLEDPKKIVEVYLVQTDNGTAVPRMKPVTQVG